MYRVSADFKERMESCAYTPYTQLDVYSAGGVFIASVDNDQIVPGTCKVTGGSTNPGVFKMGAAVIGKFEATVWKSDITDEIEQGMKVQVLFGISTQSGKHEMCNKGFFYLEEPEDSGNTIKLKGHTAMSKFDRIFDSSGMSDPATRDYDTMYKLMLRATEQCGVSINSIDQYFSNNEKLTNPLALNQLTEKDYKCRQLLMWIGECTGNYADIDRDGAFRYRWYNLNAFDEVEEMEEDGDTSPLDVVDAKREYHVIKYKMLRSFTHWKDPLEVDNVMFYTKERVKAKWFGGGQTKNYCITASGTDNPFIYYPSSAEWAGVDKCDYPNPMDVWQCISKGGTPRAITPMTLTAPTDPSVEVGDPIVVIGRDGSIYKAYVTNMTMVVGGSMQLVCDAETAERHKDKSY